MEAVDVALDAFYALLRSPVLDLIIREIAILWDSVVFDMRQN